MIAGTVSERELLPVSLHVFLAFQEKKTQTKSQQKKPTTVYLQFLEAGLNLVQLWQQGYCVCVVVSASLPPAPSFPALRYSTEANLRTLSAPPWDILAKSRIEAVSHKAQKHELFLLKHQALKQMRPTCTASSVNWAQLGIHTT